MAERFGWTLKKVDALTMADLTELNAIDEGTAKATESEKASQEFFAKTTGKR